MIGCAGCRHNLVMNVRWLAALIPIACAVGCVVQAPSGGEETSESEGDGDGDGDIPGDGDNGDGDGDNGDGDGDIPGDGDGDGDIPGDGDGDGEPRVCGEGLTLCCPDGDPNCADSWNGPEGVDGDPQWQQWGCVDPQVSRRNCGGCANACPSDDLEDGHPGRCEASECQPYYQGCVEAESPTVTCDDVCASVGKSCAGNECGFNEPGGYTMRVFTSGLGECFDGNYGHAVDVACDEPIPAEEVPAAVACCCTLE